jgi:hypothetical protein
MLNSTTRFLVNDRRFVIGEPQGDTGLTSHRLSSTAAAGAILRRRLEQGPDSGRSADTWDAGGKNVSVRFGCAASAIRLRHRLSRSGGMNINAETNTVSKKRLSRLSTHFFKPADIIERLDLPT